jgi:hypothetical protein
MLALADSASAAEPETETTHKEGTAVIANCGGFKVLDDFVEDGRMTTFFDSAGNPDYARVYVQIRDFFYNSKTGEGFAETNTISTVIDLQSGAEETVGLPYHVTVPGEGVVLLDAGKVIFNAEGEVVFEAGLHQVLSGDTEKFCDALA